MKKMTNEPLLLMCETMRRMTILLLLWILLLKVLLLMTDIDIIIEYWYY